jgi:hypothetical protein
MTAFFTSEYLTKSEYLTQSLCEMAVEVATHGPYGGSHPVAVTIEPVAYEFNQFYDEPVSEPLSARWFRWLAPQALFKVLL